MSLLNTPQYEAVTYGQGPCLVLAGAGSGKTRVITHKIAWLIEQQGFEPRHIAALTFTNKAAGEMRGRLEKLLKVPKQAKQVTVSTFHALGVAILRREAHYLGLKNHFSIMDSDDCLGILQELMVSSHKPIVRRVQTTVSLWKNHEIKPDQAQANAASDEEATTARVYQRYVDTLRAYQAVDFDDLIGLPVALLREQEAVRDAWQRRLRYFLVDEYQDTNACQYALLKLLVTGVGKKPLFTAVGDDDQAIYSWRGATIENLRRLPQDFPDLKVIKLEQNYRSSTRILQAANAVIANNPKLFTKSLWSDHGLGDPVTVICATDDAQEADEVAMRLSAHRFERRAKFSDYAILYRGNHQARVFEKALRRERIPYILSGGQSFFERAEIRDIISYLRLIANQDDDPAFIRAITTPKRGIGQATLAVLGQVAQLWQCSLFEAVYKGGVEAKLTERQIMTLREFCEVMNQLEQRARRKGAASRGDNAVSLLDDLMVAMQYEAYLYDHFEPRTAQNKWQNVLDFVTWLKEKSTGGHNNQAPEKSVLELAQMVCLMSMLEGREDEQTPDAVQMSTLHAAKGLEYPHVFLVGVEEGILPHPGHADAPADVLAERIKEERRLMYVGLTRAQRSLHLSWCQKRQRGGALISCERSRFIQEMRLDEDDAAPKEAEKLTPQARLAQLKALLAS